jgi:hypothetical protein
MSLGVRGAAHDTICGNGMKFTDVSNTVTIYEFNQDDELRKLHVYVSHVAQR